MSIFDDNHTIIDRFYKQANTFINNRKETMTQDLFEHLYKLQISINEQQHILHRAYIEADMERRRILKQIVIEDVPHQYQDRLLSLLED